MVLHKQTEGADSDRSNLRLGAVALVILVGMGLLMHPLYLWPHYNQTPYTPANIQQVSGDTLDQSAVIEYESLPQAAQESFDAARNDGREPLWSGEDDRAIAVMQNHRFVQYQGKAYEYTLVHSDSASWYMSVLRGVLTALGVFLVTWGSLAAYSKTWRALSPIRSLLFVAMAFIALVATQTYDVVYSGASGQLPLPNTVISLLPLVMAFLGVGAVVRSRGGRSLLPVAGISIAALVVGAVVFNAPPVVPLILGIMLIVAGTPWMLAGYALTSDSEPI